MILFLFNAVKWLMAILLRFMLVIPYVDCQKRSYEKLTVCCYVLDLASAMRNILLVLAFFNLFTHSEAVIPVVKTSSTRRTFFWKNLSGFLTLKAPLTFFCRCNRESWVCDNVFLTRCRLFIEIGIDSSLHIFLAITYHISIITLKG